MRGESRKSFIFVIQFINLLEKHVENRTKMQLLDTNQTFQKIRRMAYQIYENNFEEPTLILAGIQGEGYIMAEYLVKELQAISSIEVIIAKVSFDKSAVVQPDILIESDVDTFKNKPVVLIDDVLNTGKTLAFCLRPFMTIPLKRLQVAVLVDRNHPKFPISADYIGYSLSTTLSEHIEVRLSNTEDKGVYLY